MSHLTEVKRIFSAVPSARETAWGKGEYLCREGFGMDRLFLLLSGRSRIFRELNNGKTVLYRIYLPGSIIGDIELFTGGTASCSSQCITPVRTLSISMDGVRSNRRQNAELLYYIGRGLARKLHENSLSEAQNTSYSLESRLARYFLTFTDPLLSAGSLGQLAEWMGCSYRHLTRSLAGLHRKGGIEKSTGIGWEAVDKGILAEIAAPLMAEEARILFEPGEPLL